jgi:hypothetical protein
MTVNPPKMDHASLAKRRRNKRLSTAYQMAALTLIQSIASRYAGQYLDKTRYLDFNYSHAGADWIARVLGGNPRRCPNVLGMSMEAFIDLENMLLDMGLLTHSRHVGASEKLAVTLYILRTACSQRQAMELIQHSHDTISRWVWAIPHHCYVAEAHYTVTNVIQSVP